MKIPTTWDQIPPILYDGDEAISLRVLEKLHRDIERECEKNKSSSQPADCGCNMRTKLLGDGCEKCNPELNLEIITERMEEAEEKLKNIYLWCEAYPLSVFPEPDFKKAAKILKGHGMTIDSISASNMRHVLKGVKRIIDE